MKRKNVRILEYNTIFTPEEEGGYSVSVPDLPGCFSQGDTFEEAKKNIAEAIELYLEDVDKELYYQTPKASRKEIVVPISVQIHA
jgi:predicted RNase H-like HicB family nuclease